jgi:hypothetical protein
MKNLRLVAAILGLAIVISLSHLTPASAQIPLPFGRSSEKKVKLNLHPDAGPWLVMCASFDGDDGKQQAVRLANELRKSHGLKSYVYREDFDYSREISDRGRGYQRPTDGGTENLRKRQMRLANLSNKTEYAVLVGDFDSVESQKAQQTLAKVKNLKPESLELYSSDINDSAQAGEKMRAASETFFGSGDKFARMDNRMLSSNFPLRMALLVQNPILPPEKLNQVDEYIVKINQYLKYTLLKNPQAYTLKIASFSGQSVVRPQEIQSLQMDKTWMRNNKEGKNNAGLVEAAKRAKILTEYLRSKGVEAYQFHDRYSSYVCVGSFDWVSKGEGANAIGNPEVEKLANQFKAKPVAGGITTYKLPARLLEAGVTCDANPLTVAVPTAKGMRVSAAAMRR